MTTVKTPEAPMTGLHDRTGFLFGKIGWRATRLFAAALEPMGLRPKHYGVLNFLDAHPGASQQELGATMGIDPSSVVAISRRMNGSSSTMRTALATGRLLDLRADPVEI